MIVELAIVDVLLAVVVVVVVVSVQPLLPMVPIDAIVLVGVVVTALLAKLVDAATVEDFVPDRATSVVERVLETLVVASLSVTLVVVVTSVEWHAPMLQQAPAKQRAQHEPEKVPTHHNHPHPRAPFRALCIESGAARHFHR